MTIRSVRHPAAYAESTIDTKATPEMHIWQQKKGRRTLVMVHLLVVIWSLSLFVK